MEATASIRILIYSHDTFGLGHLRRCRAIAHAMVERNKNLSVLILSGSPIIGSYDFRARVDFVRVPGVIKLRNGEYTSLSLLVDTQQTLDIRESIIRHTAEIFDPHLFLVDKEPLGLRGEVKPTLEVLKHRGTRLVLGLRDVMDEPASLAPEWQRKNVMPALQYLYDDIWVYGLREICDPLEGLSIPPSVRAKMQYTGYLQRSLPATASGAELDERIGRRYVLVTAGGGGDGESLIDWVISAYEHDPTLEPAALIVFGPFMAPDHRDAYLARISKLDNVGALVFDAHIESLIDDAVGMVTMGGYNTFCEILSFDKPAVIVPRTEPRMEQYIRAERAEALGLAQMLPDDGSRVPQAMADAIRQLPHRRKPSSAMIPGMLDGLDMVNRLMLRAIGQPDHGLEDVARRVGS